MKGRVKKEKHTWGDEYHLVDNGLYGGKILAMHADYQSSIHYHSQKDETFIVLQGVVELELWDNIKSAKDKENPTTIKHLYPADTYHIEANIPHRFSAYKDESYFLRSLRAERIPFFEEDYTAYVIEIANSATKDSSIKIEEGGLKPKKPKK